MEGPFSHRLCDVWVQFVWLIQTEQYKSGLFRILREEKQAITSEWTLAMKELEMLLKTQQEEYDSRERALHTEKTVLLENMKNAEKQNTQMIEELKENYQHCKKELER